MNRRFEILRLRLRSLFRRTRVERELDKELAFHLAQQVEENIARLHLKTSTVSRLFVTA